MWRIILRTFWCIIWLTMIIIDREVLSVNIVIQPVSWGFGLFFFHLCNGHALQQNLAIASFSNLLCLFSNSRRSYDSTNRWPLPMTLIRDLDLCILSHKSVPAEQNISKFLQSVAKAMAILQMQKYPEQFVQISFTGTLCFLTFYKNAFLAVTFELKHLGWWFLA